MHRTPCGVFQRRLSFALCSEYITDAAGVLCASGPRLPAPVSTGSGSQFPSLVEPGTGVWIGIKPAGVAKLEADVDVVVVTVVETLVKVVV